LTFPLDGKKAEPVAEALNETDTEAIPYRAAFPVALPAKSDDNAPVAGINVVALPLAENEALTLPPAAGTYKPVAEPVNEALSWADPGSKAEPAPESCVSADREPLP
jgi:hypothetical protein